MTQQHRLVLALYNAPSSECNCADCVGACEHRPCWGTPDEIKRIIEAGFGNRLMRDWWEGDFRDDCGLLEGSINMLQPAIVGHEGQRAPLWPNGRCTFLTDDGLCELHAAGLKPSEGKISICSDKAFALTGFRSGKELHEAVARTWDNEQARELVEERQQ
jgi:hypothetical protein